MKKYEWSGEGAAKSVHFSHLKPAQYMRFQLRDDGMKEEEILLLESEYFCNLGVGLGYDPDDFDPTLEQEVLRVIEDMASNFSPNIKTMI